MVNECASTEPRERGEKHGLARAIGSRGWDALESTHPLSPKMITFSRTFLRADMVRLLG